MTLARTTPRSECMRCHKILPKIGSQPQLCESCIKELGQNSEVKDYAVISNRSDHQSRINF
jgi:predicted amidophosphoribosyltransferase